MLYLQRVQLKDVAEIQTGPFGSQLHASDYKHQGVPVIMPQDIASNIVNTDKIARISTEDAKRLSRHRLKYGDTIYSRRGDVERHAFIDKYMEGWLCGTGCLRVRPDIKQVLPKYVSFFLSCPESCTWIKQNAHGTTMPNLNTTILGNAPFAYPSLATQATIVAILDALTEKIATNHRINDNLAA